MAGRAILGWCALAIALSGCAGAPSAAANREEPMQVTFQSEGGIAHFPGLSRPTTMASDQMTAPQAAELRDLVEAAGFFERPAQVGKPAPGAADYRQYTITVDADDRRHTVKLIEPVDDPDLQRLVRFLQEQAKALRAKPSGSP
jgi:hypothetical protein